MGIYEKNEICSENVYPISNLSCCEMFCFYDVALKLTLHYIPSC